MNKTTYKRAAAEFEARNVEKPKSINLDDLQGEAEGRAPCFYYWRSSYSF